MLPDSPYYVERLAPDERARYRDVLRLAVACLERAGFAALEAGRGYGIEDFNDRCHLSEAGGRRLAAEVAPKLPVGQGPRLHRLRAGLGDEDGRPRRAPVSPRE